MIPPENFSFIHKRNKEEKFLYVYLTSFNTKPTEEVKKEVEEKTRHGFNIPAYCNYIFDEKWDEFFDVIVTNLKKLYAKKILKTAIIFKKNDMIERFYDQALAIFPKAKITKFYKSPKEDKIKEIFQGDIILTNDKSFGTAVDVPNLRIMVNTSPFSSDVVAEQLSGRLREIKGKKVVFVDIADEGFPKTKNQRKRRLTSFKKLSTQIINN